LGFSVVIWPDNIMEKDINDMVMNGKMSADEIVNTINKNTFRGPMALLNFNNWKHT